MQWRAAFAGDIYFHAPAAAGWLAPPLARLIAAHDVRACNFEGVIAPRRAVAAPLPKIGPIMAQAPGALAALREAGFNVFCLANNHSFDLGVSGLRATLRDMQGDLAVGAGLRWQDAYALRTMAVGGTRVGFLAFGEAAPGALVEPRHGGGFAWIGHPDAERAVRAARKRVDVLLVQCHAGVESIAVPLPEWRLRYRQLIAWGADAVIAHHPHEPQGWERYQGKPIVYSLGNFYFPLHPTGWGALLSMTFDGRRLVAMRLHATEDRGARAALAPHRAAELRARREALRAGRYEALVAQAVQHKWNELYRRRFRLACDGITLATLGRDLARALLRPTRTKHVRLLQNLRIESDRWAAERALSQMARLPWAQSRRP